MVPIPYGVTYTTTVTGQIAKHVGCDRCGEKYVYFLEATGSGEGMSFLFLNNEGAQQSSYSAAEHQLMEKLDKDCDVIPCPNCGHIQHHMLPRACELRFGWMKTVSNVGFVVSGIAGGVAAILTLGANLNEADYFFRVLLMWGVISGVALATIALYVRHSRLCMSYDPNATPVSERLQKAKEYAYTEEEFLEEFPPNPEPSGGSRRSRRRR